MSLALIYIMWRGQINADRIQEYGKQISACLFSSFFPRFQRTTDKVAKDKHSSESYIPH